MGAVRRRRSDRALRPPMRSPGRPTAGRREHRQRFWEGVAGGLTSEVAGTRPWATSRHVRSSGIARAECPGGFAPGPPLDDADALPNSRKTVGGRAGSRLLA